MPNWEETPLFRSMLDDQFEALDWRETGSPFGAELLLEKSRERAVKELGCEDSAHILEGIVKAEARADKKLIENFIENL